jgi:hypothetical protein
MPNVEIIRKVSLNGPYPRSGNFTTQKATYDWWVSLNGKSIECKRTLRAAKEAAASYGENKPKITRQGTR